MLTAGREPKAGLQFRKWAPLSLYLGLAFLLMALTGPAIAKLATAPPRPLPEGFDTFPMQLGAWQGRHTPVEPRILKATGSDAYLNAVFTNPGHEAISAWIGYYEQQRQGKSPHCPYTCSTGAGWREVESKIVPITPEVSARAVLMEKGGERKLMYYWYYHSGEWIARDHFIKLAIAKNLLTQRRSNGAIILLDTRVGNNPEEAHKQMQSFAQQLIPALQKFIPE